MNEIKQAFRPLQTPSNHKESSLLKDESQSTIEAKGELKISQDSQYVKTKPTFRVLSKKSGSQSEISFEWIKIN